MRARFIRVSLLLICLAMTALLPGPSSMMAQDVEEEEGMLQCYSYSEDAGMELQFPASGGAAQGIYLSSYAREDSSLLYDEDGSSDYYDEERRVNISIQFAGSYSGGDTGVFSFQATGTATVDIENLEDDKFNRSYLAELDTTATGNRSADGSVTIRGISAEFVPVGVDAQEIPNTEWLEPSSAPVFEELTLGCAGLLLQEETAPETSCTITTIPDPIGSADSAFQAGVVPTGFAAGETLEFFWNLNTQISATGQNVTIDWMRETGFPNFSPGFYTLTAFVFGGQYHASCTKHWSIGGGQNQPPECVSVDIIPGRPSAGDTSLEVSVQARDTDPLTYSSQLFKGSSALTPIAPLLGPRDTLSIPGGLQPGGYTMQVMVNDGKQAVFCTRNFIVAQPAGPPPVGVTVPVTSTQPPPAQPPAPTGPPQPPGPAPQPPAPPAPPPAPPPSGDCGTVQVIYLDDLGIQPNQVEIDAFIENALARGGPDYSLVISHRQRLVDRFGQQGFEQIDGLLRNLVNIAETCPFVLIVGDPDVVPFGVLPNPTNDGDVLFTDDVYGDNDHDNLTLLDIPVARIPDGYSLDLLLTQLSPSNLPASGDFTLANSKRLHADGVASQVFGPGRSLFWSLPTRSTNFDPSLVNVRYSYFMLHGASNDTRIWWGEEDVYPDAFTVAEASSHGIVLGGACYGAYTFNRTPQDSIALAFLASGARAFVGATGITYSPIWPSGPAPTGPMRFDAAFQYAFLDAASQGQAPLAAFMEAKRRLADLASTGDATAAELKMLHELLYYGKP